MKDHARVFGNINLNIVVIIDGVSVAIYCGKNQSSLSGWQFACSDKRFTSCLAANPYKLLAPLRPPCRRSRAGSGADLLLLSFRTPVESRIAGRSRQRTSRMGSLGLWDIPVGPMVLSLAQQAWHRAEHRFDVLRCIGHQLHHAAAQVDVTGAFFVHPFEVMVKSCLGVVTNTMFTPAIMAICQYGTSLAAPTPSLRDWMAKWGFRPGLQAVGATCCACRMCTRKRRIALPNVVVARYSLANSLCCLAQRHTSSLPDLRSRSSPARSWAWMHTPAST